jgi:hypothetical protein
MSATSQRDTLGEQHWDAMRDAMERGGPSGVAAYIRTVGDADAQRQLYVFGQRAFSGRDWRGKSLDGTADFTDLAIRTMLERAAAAGDARTARQLTDTANAMSFNLAADLADCWPGDDVPRERHHFERGLEAARRCIRWREELGATPEQHSMAWWARGIHELSLGLFEDALASFTRSLEQAIAGARAKGLDTPITSRGHWSVLLGEGYVAIAQGVRGDAGGPERLASCYAAIEAAIGEQPDQAGDLRFCMDQLRKVEQRHAGS